MAFQELVEFGRKPPNSTWEGCGPSGKLITVNGKQDHTCFFGAATTISSLFITLKTNRQTPVTRRGTHW